MKQNLLFFLGYAVMIMIIMYVDRSWSEYAPSHFSSWAMIGTAIYVIAFTAFTLLKKKKKDEKP